MDWTTGVQSPKEAGIFSYPPQPDRIHMYFKILYKTMCDLHAFFGLTLTLEQGQVKYIPMA
jgi:hypothetical protein